MKDILFCVLLAVLIVLLSILGAKGLDFGKKFLESQKNPLTLTADQVR
jgi:hypothetical protein